MRALLLKPAALGAAIVLGFFGVALMAFGAFAVHAPAADAQSSECGSPPTSSTILTSSGPSSSSTVGGGAAVSSAGGDSSSSDSTPASGSTDSTTTTPSGSDSTDSTSTGTDTTTGSTDTTTPSVSPSTSTSPTPQLCVEVDPYPTSGDVLPGDPASYVVWVWSLDADSSGVTATASVTAESYLGSPSFTICPTPSGATCTMDSLPVGDVYELLATVPTTTDATPDTDIALTVSVAAAASSPDSGSGTDVVVAPTSTTNGSGSTGTTSSTNTTVPALETLPTIPGTGVTATNPSDLFPTVSPSPSSGSLGLPPAKVHHVVAAADAAYAVPIDPRLLGAQLVGLVALAGAITIAIVRLSLRKPLPTTPGPVEPPDKTVAG